LSSRVLTPIAEAPLAPSMKLVSAPGQVDVASIIEADPAEAARRNSVLDMPLAQLSWHDHFRVSLAGLA
jgi:hypothetical protein